MLEFKPENVIVCRDYTKAQVLELLNKVQSEAEAFEKDTKNGSKDVNAIYINYIGFCLDSRFHTFMSELDNSEEISSKTFQLTKSGEPINLCEHSLRICQMSKTQIFLL